MLLKASCLKAEQISLAFFLIYGLFLLLFFYKNKRIIVKSHIIRTIVLII
jgi:hypothetical protein